MTLLGGQACLGVSLSTLTKCLTRTYRLLLHWGLLTTSLAHISAQTRYSNHTPMDGSGTPEFLGEKGRRKRSRGELQTVWLFPKLRNRF